VATIYCRSTDGNDGDSGATWALAKATLAAAITAAGNGGTVYVSQSHAESSASAKTFAAPTTMANMVTILCVNDAAEPPTALATTGTVTTTGSAIMNYTGHAYVYGLTFSAGSGAVSAYHYIGSDSAAMAWTFESCTLAAPGTAGTLAGIYSGFLSGTLVSRSVKFINTNVNFGATGQSIEVFGRFEWRGGTLGGTIPTTLFLNTTARGFCDVFVDGVDLSAAGSGKNLVNVTGVNSGTYLFNHCKLGSSVSLTIGAPPGPGGPIVTLVNCDSASTNYRIQRDIWEGDIYQETTIVRTGGSTDGAASVSRKMVSGANARYVDPLVLTMPFWNTTTGSAITPVVEVVSDNVTFTDAELWVEFEYLGNSSFPISSFVNDRSATILTAAANQTTSTATWTTTGLATPVKQKLSTSFTAQKAGIVVARVYLAKASSTVYVDGKVLDAGGNQYPMLNGDWWLAAAAGGLLRTPSMAGGMVG
jgi:hypothetical protein